MSRVNLTIGETEIQSEFNDSETAQRICEALPIESSGSYWGGEFYFPIPVQSPRAQDAREVVEAGTVAYWPDGACLCIFWGPTPASQGVSPMRETRQTRLMLSLVRVRKTWLLLESDSFGVRRQRSGRK